MCEFLERMRLTGTPTEEVREWSGMTHRVVELTGPFPTPDEMCVELWLHEESATRLLDMCDRIDAEFHKVQAENAKLEKRLAQYGLFCEVVGDPAVEFANLRRELHRVERENEKLRELVRDMWEGYNDPRCDECHLKDTPTCVDCPICAREASVLDRMRELGVEVD